MKNQNDLSYYLRNMDPGFAQILMKIPPREEPLPTPYWLHLEMIERYQVVCSVGIDEGSIVLEIGCGPHALTTVPLAYIMGAGGTLLTTDIGRWTHFHGIVSATGLQDRIHPFQSNCINLPLRSSSCDFSVLIHGIRSLRDQPTMVKVFKEMMRISPAMCVAETVPLAYTKAQKAHLEMYNLREELFEALSGRKDDIHYLPSDILVELIEEAGGTLTSVKSIDARLPLFLAFFPKDMILKIRDRKKQTMLLEKWEIAYENLQRYGEEHPPVVIIQAVPQE
jgi:hypothetical protein